jgi:hypothetical protein
MIKICSFFSLPIVDERIGKVYSLALSFPKNIGPVAGTVRCLCPTWDIVRAYKARQITEEEYTAKYHDLMVARWPQVIRWLRSLQSDQDIYLCCWERTGFCHRYLVAKLIRKFRPDLEVRVS